jgi:hypothetical protein
MRDGINSSYLLFEHSLLIHNFTTISYLAEGSLDGVSRLPSATIQEHLRMLPDMLAKRNADVCTIMDLPKTLLEECSAQWRSKGAPTPWSHALASSYRDSS